MFTDAPTRTRPAAHSLKSLSRISRVDRETPVAGVRAQPEAAAPAASEPAAEAATEADLAKAFKLLADETRLRVLMALLREGESHVSGLCERLSQSQPAVSHHLALLREAGLIEVRREGKHNYYRVLRPHFEAVMGDLFAGMLAEASGD